MSLAPGAFVRHDVLRFGKIGSPRVLRWDQVLLNQNSVRRYVMIVAGVIVRRVASREISSEWIYPGARTDAGLAAV